MLTRVLIEYFAKTAVVLLLVATAIAYLVLGEDAAQAVLASGFVVCLNNAALIWVVGVLIDPRGSAASKATVVVVLFGKLAAVGALLWWLYSVKGMHELGMLIGIAAAIGGLVLGVNRGSASPEGQRAIAEAEKDIAQEMEDNDDDSQ